MKTFYGYIRVSTERQARQGVSLPEQYAAIYDLAKKLGVRISECFEEHVTAAKTGRPEFGKMIKGLKAGKACGVIIPKVDRSARHLSDWADIEILVDSGVEVYIASGNLNLATRGGRIAAAIEAVIAADYIRNLREETKKGVYGRLKQGLIPFQAPLGYLNMGGGKAKTIDPIRGPLVRRAFAQYAAGNDTLDSLLADLHAAGLRNRNGGLVSRNGLSEMLNNPFYAGVIKIRRSGETFSGKHEPLISMDLFKRVQARLSGRYRSQGWKHDFTFRGLFTCSLCKRVLVGERQKGHVYYRCQTKACPTKCFREKVLEQAMFSQWPPIAASQEWRDRLTQLIAHALGTGEATLHEQQRQVRLAIGAIESRIARLIDAMVDGMLDKESFHGRKEVLLLEKASLEQSLETQAVASADLTKAIDAVLELASEAQLSYEMASTARRREMAIRLCSNRTVAEKEVSIEPCFPLSVIAGRLLVTDGARSQYATRTLEETAHALIQWAKKDVERQRMEADLPPRPTWPYHGRRRSRDVDAHPLAA